MSRTRVRAIVTSAAVLVAVLAIVAQLTLGPSRAPWDMDDCLRAYKRARVYEDTFNVDAHAFPGPQGDTVRRCGVLRGLSAEPFTVADVVGCYTVTPITALDSSVKAGLLTRAGEFELVADSLSAQRPDLRRVRRVPQQFSTPFAFWSFDSTSRRVYVQVGSVFGGYSFRFVRSGTSLEGRAIEFTDDGTTPPPVGIVRAVRSQCSPG
jgi:hypothetical protein